MLAQARRRPDIEWIHGDLWPDTGEEPLPLPDPDHEPAPVNNKLQTGTNAVAWILTTPIEMFSMDT